MFGGKPAPKTVEEPASSEPAPPAEQAILDLEQTMGTDWYEALKDEFTKPYFQNVRLPHLSTGHDAHFGCQIRNFLISETRKKATIYPKSEYNRHKNNRLTPVI